MRQKVRDNSLSLVIFGLFILFLLGHSMAGYYAYNADQHEHQQPPIRYAAYLVSGHFWATVFENWESEFLQMAAYVILTHDHALDFLLALEALARPDAAYVGMIGSRSKRATFTRLAREHGVDAAPLVCPIGAGFPRDKRPEVIAAFTAAELLARMLEPTPGRPPRTARLSDRPLAGAIP